MSQKLKNILLLYLRETGFMVLALLGFASLGALNGLVYWGIQKNLWDDKILSVKILPHKHLDIFAHKFLLGDELLSTVFILGLWMMFTLGLMIKRQIANDRASLLPGYRVPHIAVFSAILALTFVIVILLSESTVILTQEFLRQSVLVEISKPAIYLVIILLAFSMLGLGYLSIGYAVFLGYVLLTILGQNLIFVLQAFSMNSSLFQAGCIFLTVVSVLFIRRLWTVKNENFEYPFLLVWPPQKTMLNQASAGLWAHNLKTQFTKTFGIKISGPALPDYFKMPHVWARAGHWGCVSRTSYLTLLVWAALGLLPFCMVIKSSLPDYVINPHIEANFLLLTGAPVLLTIITNYKNMIFWSFDLIKPVSRTEFFKEQGLKFIKDLAVFWLIVAVYFGAVPLFIISENVDLPYFASYLFMTFGFSVLSLGWLAVLSSLTDEKAVAANGLVLCLIIMCEFYWAREVPSLWLMINALLCFTAGALFFKLAFEKWTNHEF